MHLLDAWTLLSTPDLARLIGVPIAVLLATVLPGRRVTRAAALVVTAAVAPMAELAAPPLVRAGWVLLWLGIAWQAGAQGHDIGTTASRRRGGFESGAIALPLGVGLVLLLLAAVSRQSLSALDARRASLGAVVVGAGLLHLMMRRHGRRAILAFAAMGLGLELLAASARAADVAGAGAPAGVALLATSLVCALTVRIAGARERWAGSALVSDAHELHD